MIADLSRVKTSTMMVSFLHGSRPAFATKSKYGVLLIHILYLHTIDILHKMCMLFDFFSLINYPYTVLCSIAVIL